MSGATDLDSNDLSGKSGGGGRKRRLGFGVAALLVTLLLAGVVSSFASPHPDGLDTVSQRGCTVAEEEITGGECIAQGAADHELGDSPLADYGIIGITNPYLSTGLSGVLGVLATFAIGYGLFWLVRRRPAAGSR